MITRVNHISFPTPNHTKVKAAGYESMSSNEGLCQYCTLWISLCI